MFVLCGVLGRIEFRVGLYFLANAVVDVDDLSGKIVEYHHHALQVFDLIAIFGVELVFEPA